MRSRKNVSIWRINKYCLIMKGAIEMCKYYKEIVKIRVSSSLIPKLQALLRLFINIWNIFTDEINTFIQLLSHNFVTFFKISIQHLYFFMPNFRIEMCLILEANCVKFLEKMENCFCWEIIDNISRIVRFFLCE